MSTDVSGRLAATLQGGRRVRPHSVRPSAGGTLLSLREQGQAEVQSNADSVSQLVNAVPGLVGAVVRTALIVFVLIKFRSSLADFFSNLGEFNIKASGLEVTARRQQIEAAVALGAAIAKPDTAPEAGTDPSAAAGAVADALPHARAQRRLLGSLVLWVDDRPSNNIYERRAREALGVRFTLATSTEEALQQLRHQSCDMIISDMGRPPDQRAGYTLLDQLRRHGDRTPFFIYASSKAPEHVQEARDHGAIGCTNSPQELIATVTSVLAARARH